MTITDKINKAAADRRFIALTLCQTNEGWQASMEVSPGKFSIRVALTPAAALEAVLGDEPAPDASIFD